MHSATSHQECISHFPPFTAGPVCSTLDCLSVCLAPSSVGRTSALLDDRAAAGTADRPTIERQSHKGEAGKEEGEEELIGIGPTDRYTQGGDRQ